MKGVLNDVQSREMHSEDDKALLEERKKRSVKTHAQLQVLEKFFNEHKYPTESIKTQLAESIGLTEKQVSAWFCHRRSKDKSSMNTENYVIRKHDLSSGVVHDHGSGHRQDSYGSIKQGHDSNFGDASLGSGSSLRDMSNHNKGDPSDVATSRYVIPKFPIDVKTRPSRSGYLKVKGQNETTAITAVMRQLGNYYREDGPPLAVEFDLLPPCAFESSLQNPVDVSETCYAEEAEEASPDFSDIHQHPNFSKVCDYNSRVASHDSNMDRTHFRKLQDSDIHDNYIHPKFKQNTSLSNNGAYCQRMNSLLPFGEVSGRHIFGGENRYDYGTRYRYGFEGKRMTSVQPFGENLNRVKECSIRKYNDLSRNISKGENIENISFDQLHHRQTTAKDGRTYAERWARMTDENQVHKRTRNEVPRSYI